MNVRIGTVLTARRETRMYDDQELILIKNKKYKVIDIDREHITFASECCKNHLWEISDLNRVFYNQPIPKGVKIL